MSLSVAPERQHLKNETEGIFVTRLGKDTTSANVAIHVLRETGITVRPEKLRTKYDTYTSFLIPIKKNSRRYNILLDANNWPMGCLVGPFER